MPLHTRNRLGTAANSYERRHSGLYTPADPSTVKPYTNDELRALIKVNPWYDPDLRGKRRGNSPDSLAGIDPDFRGVIAPARASLGGWEELLTAASVAATLADAYTTAKSVIHPTNIIAVPANFFQNIGRVIRITVLAGVSNIVTTPGTMVFQVQMGPTANIVAFTTGNLQLNATAHTLLPTTIEIWLTVRAIGVTTAANFMGMGRVQGVQWTLTAGQTDAANTPPILSAPATAPAVGTGWDSTVANILDFWAGFSISNGANEIQVQQYIVELLN